MSPNKQHQHARQQVWQPTVVLVAVAILLFSSWMAPRALAQGGTSEATSSASKATTADFDEPSEIIVTPHRIRVAGRELAYSAHTGYMSMKNDAGELRAQIFFVAYTLEDGGADRPVTFAYNGGPGSASLWVHLGAMGPKRVRMTEEGMPLPPPYELVVNEATWLQFTDLVFIDPVSTGFSRPAPGVDGKEFHGVEEDVASVGDFISSWLTRFDRWSSPKFLAGESYGTTRSAGLSSYLQERRGIYLNGIVLISSVLDFRSLRMSIGNDLPFIAFLPSYTTTAWFHHRLSPALQDDFDATVAAAREFAIGPYASALLRGASLDPQEHERVVARLAELTGLSSDFIERAHLRVNASRFRKELLRDQGLTVARLDARHTGLDRDSAGERPEYDAADAAIRGVYSAMINDYLRNELGFETNRTYESSGDVRPWNWGSAGEGYTYVTDLLRSAMSQNRYLRVLVANGYYDLATPFFGTEYTFDHLGGDPSLRDRVRLAYYPAGHMMYAKVSALHKLSDDVREFMQEAMAQGKGE